MKKALHLNKTSCTAVATVPRPKQRRFGTLQSTRAFILSAVRYGGSMKILVTDNLLVNLQGPSYI